MQLHRKIRAGSRRTAQSGYMLLAVIVMATVGAILAAAALPRIAQEIRREREAELIHRGTQYARAIKRFYKKNGRYPARLEELENTNNIKYLRKRYRDPITGSDEWRIIRLGEAKVTPRLFGNQPAGTGAPGTPGTSATSGTSAPSSGATTTPPGQPMPTSTNGPDPTAPATAGNPVPPGTQTTGATTTGTTSSGTSSGASGTSSQRTFGGAPIVGVASTSERESLKELNGKNHYNEWEFVYDPRFDPSNRQGGGVQVGLPQPGQRQPGQQNPPATTPTMPQVPR